MRTSWFPIRIKMSDTQETFFVRAPEDLPKGRAFTVVELRVKVDQHECS